MTSPPWDYIAKLVCIGDSGCGKSSLTIRLCEGRFVAHHDVTIGVEFGSRIVPVGPPHSRDYFPSSFPDTTPATSSAVSTPGGTSSSTDNPPESTTIATTQSPANGGGGLPEPPRTAQKHMKLSLWDTAGQETYKSVTRSYFRGASGALLVFDLTRRATFTHVTDWLSDLRQIAEPDIVVVLVGNKADLAQDAADGRNAREVTRADAEAWARRNGVLEYVETSAKSGAGVERAFMRVADRIYHNIMAGRYDLNDRRSGVKGPNAGGAATSNSLRLAGDAAKGAASGCC